MKASISYRDDIDHAREVASVMSRIDAGVAEPAPDIYVLKWQKAVLIL